MDTLTNKQIGLLRDHTDARMVTAEPNELAAERNQIVQLDPDHPGFRDASYRARRNAIARLALQHRDGDVRPVEYTAEEHETWRTVWKNLAPLHDRYACRQYLAAADVVRLDRDRVPQFAA